MSKVLDDNTYLEGNAEEEEDDEEPGNDQNRDNGKDREADRYWENLELLHYENKTEAEDISFKQFM